MVLDFPWERSNWVTWVELATFGIAIGNRIIIAVSLPRGPDQERQIRVKMSCTPAGEGVALGRFIGNFYEIDPPELNGCPSVNSDLIEQTGARLS
jgi:hypothetical protein